MTEQQELTRGQKAARTRARNLAAAQAEAAVQTQLAAPDAGVALTEWKSIIEGLENISTMLQGIAELEGAAVRISVGASRVVATHNGNGWRLAATPKESV